LFDDPDCEYEYAGGEISEYYTSPLDGLDELKYMNDCIEKLSKNRPDLVELLFEGLSLKQKTNLDKALGDAIVLKESEDKA
jgi:hypothetical protein